MCGGDVILWQHFLFSLRDIFRQANKNEKGGHFKIFHLPESELSYLHYFSTEVCGDNAEAVEAHFRLSQELKATMIPPQASVPHNRS